MLSQPEHYRRNSHKCLVGFCPLVITGGDAPKPLQTQHTAFDHIAQSVAIMVVHTRSPAIANLLLPVRTLIPTLGDQVANTTFAQQLTAGRITVALVKIKVVRTLARSAAAEARHPYRIEDRLQKLAVAALAFGEHEA